ncbi:MAG: LLM class flavin-dependent oxidoreductase [Thermomicrobiales bacterium]
MSEQATTAGGAGVPMGPLSLGLFDIMQVDPGRESAIADLYAQRLDTLAFADVLGYTVAFSAERHFLPNYACPSATAWVAAATQRTSRMRLGMLGYTLPIHNPIALAEEIAVLDLLSRGRLEVGLGLGHRIEELVALGVDPGERITLFQERLAILQALWSGGTIAFERGGVVARDVAIAPLPEQTPHPPLWFAGTEPAGAHWMGARGLGLAVGFKPTQALIPAVAAFLAGRAVRTPEAVESEPARPAGTIALMRPVYLSDSDDRALDEIADDLLLLDEQLGNAVGPGSRADRKADAQARAEGLLRDEVMFAGGVESVAQAIVQARKTLRFDLLLANVHAAGVSDERVQRTVRRLAEEVRPRLVDAELAAASMD